MSDNIICKLLKPPTLDTLKNMLQSTQKLQILLEFSGVDDVGCHHSVMWLWCREGRCWAEDNGKNLASMQLSIYAEREIILRFSRTTPTLNNPLLCRRIWWHYRVSKGKYCFFFFLKMGSFLHASEKMCAFYFTDIKNCERKTFNFFWERRLLIFQELHCALNPVILLVW